MLERAWWKLDGKDPVRCSLDEWGDFMEHGSRIVQQDWVGGKFLSTVFLGIDHNFLPVGPPLLFETMLFGPRTESFVFNGRRRLYGRELYCERTPTWDAAVLIHLRALRQANAGLCPTCEGSWRWKNRYTRRCSCYRG